MKKQFEKLWIQLGSRIDSESEFQLLYDSYTRPERFYHNLNHIQSCLNDFRKVSHLTKTPELVEVAIWYHDVIYDANNSDNEQKSADVAVAACSKAGLSNTKSQEVHDLILMTKHNKTPRTINQKIITDVDLAILGKPFSEYDMYEKAIRKEYSQFPEEDFRKGRVLLLRIFLEKSSIYSLEYFKNKYQSQAIRNIQKAISELE